MEDSPTARIESAFVEKRCIYCAVAVSVNDENFGCTRIEKSADCCIDFFGEENFTLFIIAAFGENPIFEIDNPSDAFHIRHNSYSHI